MIGGRVVAVAAETGVHPIPGGNVEPFSEAAVREVVHYLFRCFERLRKEFKTLSTKDYEACADVIFVNARTSLQTPDVYVGQDPMDQFFQVMFAAIKNEDDNAGLEFFSKVLEVRT